jgi:hypothetical protein
VVGAFICVKVKTLRNYVIGLTGTVLALSPASCDVLVQGIGRLIEQIPLQYTCEVLDGLYPDREVYCGFNDSRN